MLKQIMRPVSVFIMNEADLLLWRFGLVDLSHSLENLVDYTIINCNVNILLVI